MLGLRSSVFLVDFRRLRASSRLLGRYATSLRKGRGATQLPDSFFSISASMIFINFRSSTDSPGLLSSFVRSYTLLPSPSSNFPCMNDSFLTGSSGFSKGLNCIGVGWLTWNTFEQGSKMEGRPFISNWVLQEVRSFGLCTPSRHAFPNMTQPRSRRWAHGEFPFPFLDSRTLCKGGASLPMSKRMSTSL